MACKVHDLLQVGTNQARANPGKVPADVVAYITDRKAKPTESYQDVWGAEHTAAFAVARAGEIALVESMQDAVKEALKQGLPFKQFAKQITPVLQEKGWWGKREDGVQLGSPHRLRIIYDTNIRTARAAGQWQRIQEAKRALPFLRYRHGNPQRARPDHESWDGRILPVSHEFWSVAYPPNGYLCTCWVEQVTARDAQRSGVTPDEDLDLTPIEVRNPRTGVTTTTVRGVDPGFAYNPGQARMEGLRQAGIVKRATKAKPVASPEETQTRAIIGARPAPETWSDVLDTAREILRVTGDLPASAIALLTARLPANAPGDAADQLLALRTTHGINRK